MPTSTPFDAGKEALIIVNPASRSRPKAARLQEAEDWLAEQGWRVARQETEGRGDAITIAGRAAESGVSLVFVCGGDGTLNEAANGLAGSETALAVIPAGTVNIWAREAGLNKKPLEAVQLAAEGERFRLDPGGHARGWHRRGRGLRGCDLHPESPTQTCPWKRLRPLHAHRSPGRRRHGRDLYGGHLRR